MVARVLSRPGSAQKAKGGFLLIWSVMIGLWAVFSLPPILFSGVFPMDMQSYYLMGTHFQAWLPWILWPESLSGRYFPVYWLFHIAEFTLFGMSVAGYLAVQSMILLAGAVLAAFLVTRTTKSIPLAIVMIVLWYFNSPIAENVGSVGKSEPLACLLVISAVTIFYRYALSENRVSQRSGIGWPFVVSGLLVLLAIWTKETSLVAIGFALAGLVLSLISSALWKNAEIRLHIRLYFRLVCVLILAAVISQAHYLHLGATPPGTQRSGEAVAHYVTFKMTIPLILGNIRWYIEQQPDVFAFAVVAIIFLAVVGRKFLRAGEQANVSAVRDYVFLLSMFSAAAAYYCAMWIWRWPMGYYMLFPSVIFKVCFLYGLHTTRVWDRAHGLARWGLVVFFGLTASYAAVYCFYIISSQVLYSRVYTDALSRFLQLPGNDKTLIVETYPFYAEQIEATRYLLDYYTGRNGTNGHITVNGIVDVLDPYVVDPERPGNAELLQMLGVTQQKLEENFRHLPKKGDYLLTFTGNELATWFLRGVAPYYNEESQLREQGNYDMRLLADERQTLPGLYVNLWTHRPACEKHWLGFKLYQILGDQEAFLWRGRYPDGWTMSDWSLAVSPSYGHPVVVKFSAPKENLPEKITIKKDGEFFKEYEISNTDEQTLVLSNTTDKPLSFEFSLDHAVLPKPRIASQEARRIGILMRLDTMPAPHPPAGASSCFSL